MKKITAALFLCASILLTGCKGSESGSANTIGEPFDYPKLESDIQAIASDSDTLYVLEWGEDGNAAEISVFDVDGTQIRKTSLKDLSAYNIECICAKDGVVYAAVNERKRLVIRSADMESGETKTVCELENADGAEKIGIYGEKLFWVSDSLDDSEYVEPIFMETGELIAYRSRTRKIGCVDLASGENVMSDFELPISFSISENGVTVYAFDREKGYYFADYFKPDEKIYTNKLNNIMDFSFFGKDGAFVFLGSDHHGAPVSKADNESGIVEALNDVSPLPSRLCASESGYVWAAVPDTVTDRLQRVKRFDLSGFRIEGKPVRIIQSQYYPYNPFSAGVEISTEQLSQEGFALRVLSLDKNYDIARVSSNQTAASDIKEKGGFYPLNDVEGVEEYLDKCFPYIKESVTDSEGNICMLPISVEIPLIAYNEKNCSDNGIRFSSDLEEFIESIERASALPDYLYTLLPYNMIRLQLMGYTSCNDSFDTEEFRRMAKLLKERCTDDVFKLNTGLYAAMWDTDSPLHDRVLFTQFLGLMEQVTCINDSDYRAVAVPCPKSGKNMAVCSFLCVNPYSDRLAETLTYIENITKSLSEEKDSFMFSDKSNYDSTPFAEDMYGIYENGEIYFQLPGDIYLSDFNKYCNNEMTLEEFISEADRKLAAYLNE